MTGNPGRPFPGRPGMNPLVLGAVLLVKAMSEPQVTPSQPQEMLSPSPKRKLRWLGDLGYSQC